MLGYLVSAIKAEWLVYRTSKLYLQFGLPVAIATVIGAIVNLHYNVQSSGSIRIVSVVVLTTGIVAVGYKILVWYLKGSVVDRYLLQPVEDQLRSDTLRILKVLALSKGWRSDNYGSGQGLTNVTLNQNICTGGFDPQLEVASGDWLAWRQYDDDLRRFAIYHAFNKSGHVFNDDKIRLAGELESRGAEKATVQKTDYLSSIMTDQFRWDMVRSKRTAPDGETAAHLLWDGRSAIWRDGSGASPGRIVSIGESPTSNQLGASTLAFSRDGHLMIVSQSSKGLQSPDMLAPSGSGSFDWSDIKASGAAKIMQLIRYGANRELQEECALGDDKRRRGKIASDVLPFAFVRMIHRVGKPEFYALGKIDAVAGVLRNRWPYDRYVEEVLVGGIDPIIVGGGGEISESILKACSQYLDARSDKTNKIGRLPMSFPLEHGLHLLREACSNRESASAINVFMQSGYIIETVVH
mgnify:CR=1 FL=1